MRKMKESDSSWIGEIPEDWNFVKIKHALKERKENNNPVKTSDILSLLKDRGVIPYDDKGDIGNKSKENLEDYKLAYPDDIVLNSMNVIIGSVGLSKYFGAVSPVYYMLYKRFNSDCISYFNYIFQTEQFQKSLLGYGNGILAHRMRIQMAKLNSVLIPYPNPEKQQEIVSYLDEKVAHIDNIIEKTKESIEEYKKYKQSLITETVTKGLYPDVKMKDSGVEWIGEIPEHWKCKSLGKMFEFIGGYAFDSNDFITEETKNQVLRIGNIKNDSLILDDKLVYVKDNIANKAENFRVKNNDILFSMTGTKGKRDYFYTVLVNEECHKNLYINQRVGIFRRKTNISSLYFNFLLKVDRILDSIFLYETGTANQGNLGIESIRKTIVHFPPIEEQQEIANYLKHKCSMIDKFISQKNDLILNLESYKKSLIYEVVTGKKEVPETEVN